MQITKAKIPVHSLSAARSLAPMHSLGPRLFLDHFPFGQFRQTELMAIRANKAFIEC